MDEVSSESARTGSGQHMVGSVGFGERISLMKMSYPIVVLLAILAALLAIRWLKIKTASIVQIGEVTHTVLTASDLDAYNKARTGGAL